MRLGDEALRDARLEGLKSIASRTSSDRVSNDVRGLAAASSVNVDDITEALATAESESLR